MDGQEGKWFPLSGVKSGKVLLAADVKDKLGPESPAETVEEAQTEDDPMEEAPVEESPVEEAAAEGAPVDNAANEEPMQEEPAPTGAAAE